MRPDPLDLEMAWTPFDVPKCRDLYSIEQNCRRPLGHEGDHACGWAANGTRRTWSNAPTG